MTFSTLAEEMHAGAAENDERAETLALANRAEEIEEAWATLLPFAVRKG